MKQLLRIVGIFTIAFSIDAATISPKADPANAQPAYPERAKDDEVEGAGVYRLRVAADGSVAEAKVTSVPAEGYGFEEAILTIVKGWRFSPATTDGEAHDATVRGAIRFSLDDGMSRARMFAVPSATIAGALEKTVEALRWKAWKKDDAGVWISSWMKPAAGGFPDEAADPRGAITRARFHLFVPRDRFPGRIYVGSESHHASGSLGSVVYNDPALARWFLDRVEAELGVEGRWLPPPTDGRDAAIGRLIGDASRVPACTVAGPPSAEARVRNPEVLKETQRVPPRIAGLEGKVRIVTVVDEDGVPSRAEIEEASVPEGAPRDAAVGAMSLWRYRPASVDGCPAPILWRGTVSYRTSVDEAPDDE